MPTGKDDQQHPEMQFSAFASSGCKNAVRTARKENAGPERKLRLEVRRIPRVAETVHSDCHPRAWQSVPWEAAGVSFPLPLLYINSSN